MLPVLLALGACLGLTVPDVATRLRWLALVVAISAGWGLMVGIADESLGTFVAGTGLAVVNLVVGGAVGALIGKAIRRAYGAATHQAN